MLTATAEKCQYKKNANSYCQFMWSGSQRGLTNGVSIHAVLEDGKAHDQVNKRYQNAFSSGSQESIVHFKTFKKDSFSASGCTRRVETRNGYQKTEAVRGHVAGDASPVIVFQIRELFLFNTDDQLGHMYTLLVSNCLSIARKLKQER